MERKFDLIPLLDFIDPAGCDYGQWVTVGMALREEGYPASVWDAWSARDPRRYHPHECEKKWNTFAGNRRDHCPDGQGRRLAAGFRGPRA